MADPKSIHEFLPTSGNIGSLFLVDDPDSQAQSGYVTRQVSMDDVGEMVNNGIDYTQDLDTENKKVIGALNELHGVDGYDVYDNTATYAVGDICIHSNSLQVCTTAVTVAEDFDSNKWSPTTIKALLALKQNITDNSLNTTSKTIVGGINEVRNYNNLVNKPTLNNSLNGTIFKVNINNRDPQAFYKALMYYRNGATASYGLYIIFIATGNNPTITIDKIGGSSDGITFTASYISNTQIEITASGQVWGGIDIIEH